MKTHPEIICFNLPYRAQYRKCHTLLLLIKVFNMNISVNDFVKLSEIQFTEKSITSIPPEIGQLGNLQRLDLGYNKITSIPSEIGQLGNLQRLNLCNNEITS